MQYKYEDYLRSAQYIREASGGFEPEILLILGSGLGALADCVADAASVPYEDIPGFCPSTAPGHSGRLVLGELEGRRVAVMQGRMHCYEGYTAEQTAYPVRTARLLGAGVMVVTNAAGGINLDYRVGDIVLLSDHIRLMGDSPSIGTNIKEFGPRFYDMTYAYSPRLRQLAREQAEKTGVAVREGVYFYFPGPQYETPAEIRAARVLGGDLAGMSTVPEVTAANHCGMEVLGLSLVTNMAAGVMDKRIDGAEVVQEGNRAGRRLETLLRACLPHM